jgi:hypothetical protein
LSSDGRVSQLSTPEVKFAATVILLLGTSNQTAHHVLYCTLKSRGQVEELCCFENNCKLPYQIFQKRIIQYFEPEPLNHVLVPGDEAKIPSAHCTHDVNTDHPTNDIIDVLIFQTIPLSAV